MIDEERFKRFTIAVKAALALRAAFEEIAPYHKMMSVPREAVSKFDAVIDDLKKGVSNVSNPVQESDVDPVPKKQRKRKTV